MAHVNLTRKEIVKLTKAISQIASINRIVKKLDVDTLALILWKFENPLSSDKTKEINFKGGSYNKEWKNYKKILRASEDSHDSFQPRVGNCECCDD